MYTFFIFDKNVLLLGTQRRIMANKKEERLVVRIDELEKISFERAAEIAGVGLSAWARQKLRIAAIRELQEVGEKIHFLIPVTLNVSEHGKMD